MVVHQNYFIVRLFSGYDKQLFLKSQVFLKASNEKTDNLPIVSRLLK